MGRHLLTAFFCFLLLPAISLGQDDRVTLPNREDPLTGRSSQEDPADDLPQQSSPQERLEEAIEVLREMKSDTGMRDLLEEARGVFIVPDYGEAALVIGSGGGDGVLLLREDGHWSNPAFYQAGNLSAGLQAGVIAGARALVLMSDKAAANFYDEHNFSLSLDAGLVVVDRSTWARGDADEDMDVLVWSNTEGLLAEVSFDFNSIIWQEEANQDYYGRRVSPYEVLSGDVVNPNEEELQQALLEQD